MTAYQDYWNMLAFLIKLVSPFKLQNPSKHFSLTEASKSSKNKKCWYSFLYLSMMRLRHSRWFEKKAFIRFVWAINKTNSFSLSLPQHIQIRYYNQTLLSGTWRVYPHEHRVTVLHHLSSCQSYKEYQNSLT